MTDTAWNELLDELRALGGKADNVCLKTGPFGRGLFAEDPSKPVELRIPESILVDENDVVFEDGVFRVGPGSNIGRREREFIEKYQAAFSWGAGSRSETESFFASAQAIPEPARKVLTDVLRLGFLFQDVKPEIIQRRFLEARRIEYRGRTVVMSVLDLANYGHLGYLETTDGLAVKGTFSNEILIRYSMEDSYGVFLGWGFASEEPEAFSIAMTLKTQFGNVTVSTGYDDLPLHSTQWSPKITADGSELRFSFLLLGSRRFPRQPKGIFRRVMKSAGYSDVDEIFEYLRHANCLAFLNAISALEGVDGPMAGTIRKMAILQLQTLSYCYGIRDPLAGAAHMGPGTIRR